MTGVAALEVDGLRVEFGRLPAAVQAVQRVSFSVAAGETVAVVGESGSGKSVTGLAIMGLIDPPGRITEGDVRLAGKAAHRHERLGVPEGPRSRPGDGVPGSAERAEPGAARR